MSKLKILNNKYLLLALYVPCLFMLLAQNPANAIPAIQNWYTGNGVSVYFIPIRELPIVDVQILFNAGSIYDGEHPGLAMFTNALLEEGAGDWSADTIANRLEQVGTQFDTSVQRDAAIISIRSLSNPHSLQQTVETVARLLKEPTFSHDSVERVRQQMLTTLQTRLQSPDTLARDTFFKALYGDHPYNSPPDGTIDSVKAISRADIQSFHQHYYTSSNAVIAIVGDLDQSIAEQLADTLVGRLPNVEMIHKTSVIPSIATGKTIYIPYPSSQTHIIIGQVGIKRTDPDYYALYLVNHMLGGNGLVSILSQEIREKHGLAYSIYSTFIPMRQTGAFLISLQTRSDQTDIAIQIAQNTLRTFTNNGPDIQLLEEARKNVTSRFCLDLAGNGKLTSILGLIAFYGLPLDYLQTYIPNMNNITLERAKAVWNKHVHPDRLITIIVGGEKQIKQVGS
jgi:zinc protease